MTTISWALLGLISGWPGQVFPEEVMAGRRRGAMSALGAVGALVAAGLALASFGWTPFGACQMAIAGAVAVLWIYWSWW